MGSGKWSRQRIAAFLLAYCVLRENGVEEYRVNSERLPVMTRCVLPRPRSTYQLNLE